MVDVIHDNEPSGPEHGDLTEQVFRTLSEAEDPKLYLEQPTEGVEDRIETNTAFKSFVNGEGQIVHDPDGPTVLRTSDREVELGVDERDSVAAALTGARRAQEEGDVDVEVEVMQEPRDLDKETVERVMRNEGLSNEYLSPDDLAEMNEVQETRDDQLVEDVVDDVSNGRVHPDDVVIVAGWSRDAGEKLEKAGERDGFEVTRVNGSRTGPRMWEALENEAVDGRNPGDGPEMSR